MVIFPTFGENHPPIRGETVPLYVYLRLYRFISCIITVVSLSLPNLFFVLKICSFTFHFKRSRT